MDEREETRPQRVNLSRQADEDMAEIHIYTANQHGLNQADLYVDFLIAGLSEIARSAVTDPEVEDVPGLFCHILRWKGSKHGHRVLYERSDDGITVMRLLHTSRNLMDYLPLNIEP